MSKRLLWADIIRLIAIYLVIVVHSTMLTQKISSDSTFSFISFGIAKTCVPLFFMLSGALLLPKEEDEIAFFKKRFGRLFYPWLFWAVIFFLFFFNYSAFSFHELITSLKTSLRVFWFIPIIFVLYLLTPSMRVFVQHAKNNHFYFIIILWYLLTSVLPYYRNTLAFPLPNNSILVQIANFSGYFLLGYILVTKRVIIQKSISLTILLIGILWTIVNAFSLSIRETTINLSFFDYSSPNIIVLSVGVFSFLYLYSFSLEERFSEKWKNLLGTISRTILGVYLFHTFMLQKFNFINHKLSIFSFYPPIDSYLNGFIVLIFSLFFVLSLQKIPRAKKFIS